MKLGLGTAQFGLDYGVSNQRGMTPQGEVVEILALAAANGVDYLDTAPAYGESETILGRALREGQTFRIVTKTCAVNGGVVGRSQASTLRTGFLRSLENLRLEKVYALLVHQARDLIRPGGELLLDVMQDLARQGLVEKLGVSVYDGEQIDAVLAMFTPQLIQCPLNVFDQRLISSGHLARLHRLGVEIHLRSIFLQGLLLMDPGAIPEWLSGCSEVINEYSHFLAESRRSRLQGALAFALSQTDADALILGVTSVNEMSEIVSCIRNFTATSTDFGCFAIDDPRIIDPTRWRVAS